MCRILQHSNHECFWRGERSSLPSAVYYHWRYDAVVLEHARNVGTLFHGCLASEGEVCVSVLLGRTVHGANLLLTDRSYKQV